MRCNECGYNNELGATVCARCGRHLQEFVGPGPAHSTRGVEIVQSFSEVQEQETFAMGSAEYQEDGAGSNRSNFFEAAVQNLFADGPHLSGTVISTEPVYYEDPNFDPARFLNRFLLVIEFLGLPIFLLWYFVTFLGPVSLIFGVLAIVFFFRLFSPIHLLAMLGIFQHVNPFRRAGERNDQEPVQYFRIRETGGEREVTVRRKGHFTNGNIMTGDEVSIWGQLSGGTFHFRRGVSLRTGAEITLRRRLSWVFLLANIVLAAVLFGAFYEPLRVILTNLSGGAR